MLVRLVRRLVESRGTSRHMLAGYVACKARRDIECLKDRAEVG